METITRGFLELAGAMGALLGLEGTGSDWPEDVTRNSARQPLSTEIEVDENDQFCPKTHFVDDNCRSMVTEAAEIFVEHVVELNPTLSHLTIADSDSLWASAKLTKHTEVKNDKVVKVYSFTGPSFF